MSVLTIYNHGSGGSSLKGAYKGEIVNLFGNNDRSPMFTGKIITEGVGSIGDPDLQGIFGSRDATTGAYTLLVETDLRSGIWGSIVQLKNNITGAGVDANVHTVLSIIKTLNLAGKRPDAINMLGWSRGAVTCIRIAYFLHNMQDPNLRSIPINIFAVDPVAGPGHNAEPDAYTLTPNVRNYVATLMVDERRAAFKPISDLRLVVKDPKYTQSLILPFKGIHSDTAKNTTATGKISFNLALRFLYTHGTNVDAMAHYCLSNYQCWQYYEDILLNRNDAYSKPQGKVKAFFVGGGTAVRDVDSTRYVDDDFFINAHAKALFLTEFNQTFRAYFGIGKSTRNTLPWGQMYSPLIVQEMKRLDPEIVYRLESLTAEQHPSPNMAALGLDQIGIIRENRLVD